MRGARRLRTSPAGPTWPCTSPEPRRHEQLSHRRRGNSQFLVQLPERYAIVDAIQEFKVDRNLFTAEYGQGSGMVSLVSRSDGNALHGSAYEFLRNDHFDAANYFDNFFRNPKAPF